MYVPGVCVLTIVKSSDLDVVAIGLFVLASKILNTTLDEKKIVIHYNTKHYKNR